MTFGRVQGVVNRKVRQRGFISPVAALQMPFTLYTSPGVTSSSVHYDEAKPNEDTEMRLSSPALHSYSSIVRDFRTA